MPTLKFWDATAGQYVALPAISSSAPSNMVATIINTPTVASSPYTITHNMSTTNVMVQAWDVVTNDLIVVRMHITDANHVQLFFEQNCPNNVNVLVVGGAGSLAPAPVVAARMRNQAAAQSLPGNTVLIYDTLEYDTHGGCNIATGTYTVPVGQPGDYLVSGEYASTGLPAAQYAGIAIQRNGTIYANGTQYAGSSGSVAAHVSSVVRCNAGDTLQIVAIPQSSISNYSQAAGNYQYMTVHRIFSGLQAAGAFVPSQVPPPTGTNSYTDPSGEVWVSRTGSAWKRARDAVHARVSRSAVYTIPTTAAAIPIDTIERDLLALYSIPSQVFTVPVVGWYLLAAIAYGLATGSGQMLSIGAYRNGNSSGTGGAIQSSVAYQLVTQLNHSIYCAAGDTLGVRISSYPSTMSSQYADPTITFMTLDYLGTG